MINRLKSIMDPDEKRVRQEDCNEDTFVKQSWRHDTVEITY